MQELISKKLRLAAIVAAMLIAVAACGGSTESPSASPAASTAAHWTYEGEEGPDHWGELDATYTACADGSAQTPIDIVTPTGADLENPVFAYTAGDSVITNNGHTIQAVAADGNTVTVNGVASTLLQMHFHAPSEHTIEGVQYAAEMHFVHKAADGALTVVGVMIAEGASDNAAWAPYVDALTTEKGTDGSASIDWAAMLPAEQLTYRYEGSLTTPPCTEGVHWFLMTQPVELSAAQIAKITAAYDGNFRPVQALNGREVQVDTSK